MFSVSYILPNSKKKRTGSFPTMDVALKAIACTMNHINHKDIFIEHDSDVFKVIYDKNRKNRDQWLLFEQ